MVRTTVRKHSRKVHGKRITVKKHRRTVKPGRKHKRYVSDRAYKKIRLSTTHFDPKDIQSLTWSGINKMTQKVKPGQRRMASQKEKEDMQTNLRLMYEGQIKDYQKEIAQYRQKMLARNRALFEKRQKEHEEHEQKIQEPPLTRAEINRKQQFVARKWPEIEALTGKFRKAPTLKAKMDIFDQSRIGEKLAAMEKSAREVGDDGALKRIAINKKWFDRVFEKASEKLAVTPKSYDLVSKAGEKMLAMPKYTGPPVWIDDKQRPGPTPEEYEQSMKERAKFMAEKDKHAMYTPEFEKRTGLSKESKGEREEMIGKKKEMQREAEKVYGLERGGLQRLKKQKERLESELASFEAKEV